MVVFFGMIVLIGRIGRMLKMRLIDWVRMVKWWWLRMMIGRG